MRCSGRDLGRGFAVFFATAAWIATLAVPQTSLSREPAAPDDADRKVWIRGVAQRWRTDGSVSPRSLTTSDLLALRDLSGLSVSPDGRFVAFALHQADYEANAYKIAWFIVEARPNSMPTNVGDGGEPIWHVYPWGRRSGTFVSTLAQWSPDNQWVAYLRRLNGQTQVWRSSRDGQVQEQVTRSEGDVTHFAWSRDGSVIVYSRARSRQSMERLRQAEADRGFRFDDRFEVVHSWAPVRFDYSTLGPERHVTAMRLSDKVEEAATSDQAEWLSRQTQRSQIAAGAEGTSIIGRPIAAFPMRDLWVFGQRKDARFARLSHGGEQIAWLQPASALERGVLPPLVVMAADLERGSTELRCADSECVGLIHDMWWAPNDREIIFLKREGWAASRRGLYIWNPHTGRTKRVLTTDAVLAECAPSASHFVCFYESAVIPRRIVAIDLQSGDISTIADPNFFIGQHTLGKAEKLEWNSPSGHRAFGYLVRPVGHRSAERVPLVVVQYRAAGFLRGGVGDEYPVQLFANAGMAVLVFDKPDDWTLRSRAQDALELENAGWQDSAKRRRVHESLMAGLNLLEEAGVVDSRKIGISGLSDGASTATYALIHGRRFAAVSLSGAGAEPMMYYVSSDDYRERLKRGGYVMPGSDGNWRDTSLSLNASRIGAPVLIQAADRELTFVMEPVVVFRELGKPIDVYVFPDEYHIKWQPRHRFHIYERNVDWFRFWLQGYEDSTPEKRQQYERWRRLRDGAGMTPARLVVD